MKVSKAYIRILVATLSLASVATAGESEIQTVYQSVRVPDYTVDVWGVKWGLDWNEVSAPNFRKRNDKKNRLREQCFTLQKREVRAALKDNKNAKYLMDPSLNILDMRMTDASQTKLAGRHKKHLKPKLELELTTNGYVSLNVDLAIDGKGHCQILTKAELEEQFKRDDLAMIPLKRAILGTHELLHTIHNRRINRAPAIDGYDQTTGKNVDLAYQSYDRAADQVEHDEESQGKLTN